MSKSDKDIEKIAWDFRNDIGQANEPRLNVAKALKSAEDVGIISGVFFVSKSQLFGAEAQYEASDKSLSFATEHGVDLDGDSRRRFTAVHELSHAILGHESTRNRMQKAYSRANKTRIEESEANNVAIAILAPYELFRNDYIKDVDVLADRYGLSLRAAGIRLATLQRLYRAEFGSAHTFPAVNQNKELHWIKADDYCPKCKGPYIVDVGPVLRCVNCGFETDEYEQYTNALSRRFPRNR